MAMLYVVTYDVSDDRVRTAMAQILSRYGERVQESVFECRFTPDDLEDVRTRSSLLLAGQAASSLRVYRLCAACAAEALGMGEVRQAASGQGFIIA